MNEQNKDQKRRDFLGQSDRETGGNFRQNESDKIQEAADKLNGIAVSMFDTDKLIEMGCQKVTEEVDVYSSYGDFEASWDMPTRKETYWTDEDGNKLEMVIDHYIVPIRAEPAPEPAPEPAKVKVVSWEVSEYDGTWDAAIIIDGQSQSKLGFSTECEAKAWVKSQLTEDDKIETYQRIHQPEPYCLDRAEVIGDKVVRAYVYALHAELIGNWTLPQYIGMTVAEIEALGFNSGYDPDIITMCNNYQTESTYCGLRTGHGNKNVPTQSFKYNGRKRK